MASYHLGVLNTALPAVAADLGFAEAGGGAVVVSALVVGAFAGSLSAGQLADRCGPKRAILLNTLPLLAGGLICTAAPGLWAMLAGRLVAGLGAGGASVLVPRYLSEIAPTSIRGALGTGTQVFINIGILAAYLIGLPYEGDARASATVAGRELPWWRVMLGVSVAPALLQAAGLALCPETPAWLLWRDQHVRATRSFRRLHGPHFDPSDHAKLAQGGADGTGASGDAEQPLLANSGEDAGGGGGAEQPGWSTLWQPRYRRVLVLAGALQVLQQTSGINTVIFYSSSVFRQAGLRSPVLGSVLMGLDNLAITLVAGSLMDRAGRKSLMTTSFAGMAACLGIMSAVMLLPTGLSASGEGLMSLVSILAYILFFALGAGPIPFLYLPEVLPQEILGNAQAFCTSLNWAGTLAVGLSFPAMVSALGIAPSYLAYAALNAGGAAFVASRMVETKRKSLAQIQAELAL
eukprot:scaffold1.g5345.t1